MVEMLYPAVAEFYQKLPTHSAGARWFLKLRNCKDTTSSILLLLLVCVFVEDGTTLDLWLSQHIISAENK